MHDISLKQSPSMSAQEHTDVMGLYLARSPVCHLNPRMQQHRMQDLFFFQTVVMFRAPGKFSGIQSGVATCRWSPYSVVKNWWKEPFLKSLPSAQHLPQTTLLMTTPTWKVGTIFILILQWSSWDSELFPWHAQSHCAKKLKGKIQILQETLCSILLWLKKLLPALSFNHFPSWPIDLSCAFFILFLYRQ